MILGCMKLCGGMQARGVNEEEIDLAERAVDAALESGITMFDHADAYAQGQAEAVFGEVLRRRPGLRDGIVIQSKCGYRIQPGVAKMYDFSRDHIMRAVEDSLKRLRVERLDILLLHRPDPLMEPEEIAEAFVRLRDAGKVAHFGASNVGAAQLAFLQRSLPMQLVVNQLDLSLGKLDWIDSGILMNRRIEHQVRFPEGTLEYCREHGVQIQSWGALAQGRFTGRPSDNPTDAERETAALVAQLAESYGTTGESIVLGWLMKHPAKVQPVIGTLNPRRIAACGDAARIAQAMTRQEWYTLYQTGRGQPIP